MQPDTQTRNPFSLWLRRHQREGGASAVEFALILIPFVLLVFGSIEFGLVFAEKTMLGNAVREGARHAMFYPEDTADIEDRTTNAISGFSQIENEGQWAFNVTCYADDDDELGEEINCDDSAGDPNAAADGDYVVVRATIAHPYLTPAPGMIGLGTEIDLTETTRMRIEK